MPEPTYTWDQRLNNGLGAYRNDSTGRLVSGSQSRNVFDTYIANSQNVAKDLAVALQNGRLSVSDWQLRMAQHVKDVNINAAMQATGGRNFMTPAKWGSTGAIIKSQYQYLDNFAKEIEDGLPLDGRFVRRAQMYTENGETTRDLFHTALAEETGFDEERNVLESRDNRNCEGAGSCPGETARGWVPVGDLIPIGDRICRKNCRCHKEYRNSVTGEISL